MLPNDRRIFDMGRGFVSEEIVFVDRASGSTPDYSALTRMIDNAVMSAFTAPPQPQPRTTTLTIDMVREVYRHYLGRDMVRNRWADLWSQPPTRFHARGVLAPPVPVAGDHESHVTQDTIDTLVDLARAGHEQDFRDLAAMSGVEDIDGLWTGTRRRLGKSTAPA